MKAMCIDNINMKGNLNLTLGKYYDLTPTRDIVLFEVIDDNGDNITVRIGRFKSQRTIRSEKLRQLGI